MAEIIINGKPFVFEEKPWICNDITFKKEYAQEGLKLMKKILDKNGIVFLLNFGTLLGAVREHDFIGHDIDVDLAIYEKDVDKLVSIIPELYEEGIKLCRYHNGIIYSFLYKNVILDIDVYLHSEFPYKYRYWRLVSKLFPKFYVEETEKIPFNGGLYDVPKNPERFVKYMYGKNWRIPQKGKHARLYPRWMIHIHIGIFIARCYRYAKRHLLPLKNI